MKEIDKIHSALKSKGIKAELPSDVEVLANALDKKKNLAILWESEWGRELKKTLLDDSARCLSSLTYFESLTFDEVKAHLAKYRANMTLIATMSAIDGINATQDALDEAIREAVG